MGQLIKAEFLSISAKLEKAIVLYGPGAGLARHLLHIVDGAESAWVKQIKIAFPTGALDTAPLVALGGYVLHFSTPSREQMERWTVGLERLSKRDPFPRDRQTFAFRPVELLGIILGIIHHSKSGCNTEFTWAVGLIEQLPDKNPPADIWSLLIYHYAASLLGIPWTGSPLPLRLKEYQWHELALLLIFIKYNKIKSPAEIDGIKLSESILERVLPSSIETRDAEKIASILGGLMIALREGETFVKPSLSKETPIVVLVHGIRTSAKWFRRVGAILQDEAECKVEPIGYGFLDTFRFLLPWTRKSVIETVRWKLTHAIERYKNRPLIIVAHSFGTYCITEILKSSPYIRPAQILLCGSIVAHDFRWDALSQTNAGLVVVNECGAKDIWPPLAHSITTGYGYSGNRGFQTPGIIDRFHNLGHSGYFTADFVRKFWVPFIKNGVIVRSPFEEEMPESPLWLSLIGLRPIFPWIVWFVLILTVGVGILFWHLLLPKF